MNRERFIEHVGKCQKAVRRFLTALCCGDSSLADDLAQDTFVKAYLTCDSFREDSKFTTWIYRIAYNTFINSKRNVVFHEPISEAEQISGHQKSDSSFEYQDLHQALGRLSEKERSAILLFYMQGYSVSEIAEINDSSPEAVKQQLSRGRSHLKDFLGYGR